jgi:cobalt-zinc-cadmium efflux system outer membrane protein
MVREALFLRSSNLPEDKMKFFHARQSVAVLLAALSGFCLVGCQHFDARPIDAADNLRQLEQRTLTDAGLRSFMETNSDKAFTEWPPESWDFRLLTMTAIYYSPEVEIARAGYAEAEAARITAGERPNPSIGVNPAYNTSTPSGDLSPWILGVDLDFPIETSGKRGHRISEAEHLSDAAKMHIAGTIWDVRSNLKQAMVALWSAREQENLAKQKLAATEELALIRAAQFEAGDIGRNELMRAQIIAEQARLEYRSLGGQTAVALMNLSGAAGLAPHALDEVEIDFSDFEEISPEIPSSDARRKALLNRADILSSLAEYAANESALRLEIAKQYPDLNLSPGYEFDQGENKWQIGFQLSLPLLSRNTGPIAEAEAKRKKAAAMFTSLQAKVLSEIESAVVAFQAERERLAGADLMFQISCRQAEVVRTQYEVGEVSKQTQIQSRLEKIAAAFIRLDSQVKTQESLGELERALQMPLDETTLPVTSNLVEEE